MTHATEQAPIHDTYSHEADDEVLKRIAANAAGEMRSGDTIRRFGGEEFVIVLPDATVQTATIVAERIRLAIEAGGRTPSVTISVGFTELAYGDLTETLLKRADQAMYLAKTKAATGCVSPCDQRSHTFPRPGRRSRWLGFPQNDA